MLAHLNPCFHLVDTLYQPIPGCTCTIDISTKLIQFFRQVHDDKLATRRTSSAFSKKAAKFLNCESEGLSLKYEGEPFDSRLAVMSIATWSSTGMQEALGLEKPNLRGGYSEQFGHDAYLHLALRACPNPVGFGQPLGAGYEGPFCRLPLPQFVRLAIAVESATAMWQRARWRVPDRRLTFPDQMIQAFFLRRTASCRSRETTCWS